MDSDTPHPTASRVDGWLDATKAAVRARVVVGRRHGSPVMETADETGSGTVDFKEEKSRVVFRILSDRATARFNPGVVAGLAMKAAQIEMEWHYAPGRRSQAGGSPLSAFEDASGVRLRGDPLWFLDALRGLVTIGSEDGGDIVRGVDTQRFGGTVDWRLARLRSPRGLEISRVIRYGVIHRPIRECEATVWVDREDRVRRVSLATDPRPVAAFEAPEWEIIEFVDFDYEPEGPETARAEGLD
jgi:hypothetical protein